MTAYIVPQGYYVYTHHRATTGEIFYVGMGHERRAWDNTKRGKHWKALVAKHGRTVSIVESGLQHPEAAELERKLIALHGRKDLGLGPLVNYTDGGDGVAGLSKESRAKISDAKKALYANNFVAKEKIREGLKRFHQANPGVTKSWNIANKERWAKAKTERALRNKQERLLKLKNYWANENANKKRSETSKTGWGDKVSRATRLADSRNHRRNIVCNGAVVFSSVAAAVVWLKTKNNSVKQVEKQELVKALLGIEQMAYGYQWAYAEGI